MGVDKRYHLTAVYALAHMAVDMCCAFLIYAYVVGGKHWYGLLLVYNFCAFALQMPLGVLADSLDRNCFMAVLGCLGVLSGLGFGSAGYAGAAVLAAGIGNACFHVGGGVDVLNSSGGKAALLGIFVAPGALGIYMGGILGRAGRNPAPWAAVFLLLSAAAIWAASEGRGLWRGSGNAPVSYRIHMAGGGLAVRILAVSCFFFVVILRSYSGIVQNFPWKETVAGSGWLLTGAVVLGKAAGGVLGDRAGICKTAVCSMCAAAAGFCFLRYPGAGILAVFFWNMSMPLTLWAVAKAMPGARGFGFGLLTFGLFLGFCPVYLDGMRAGAGGMSGLASSNWAMAFMAVVSLALLRWGLRKVTE